MNKRELSRTDLRSFAFHLLYMIDRSDYQYSVEEATQNMSEHFEIEVPEDSYALTLAQAVIEEREKLDATLQPYLKNWDIKRLSCCTLLILRIALWELMRPDALPSVIINEAIELAKDFAEKDAYKFVNGVLDSIKKDLLMKKK